jgi:hypothetical protein
MNFCSRITLLSISSITSILLIMFTPPAYTILITYLAFQSLIVIRLLINNIINRDVSIYPL